MSPRRLCAISALAAILAGAVIAESPRGADAVGDLYAPALAGSGAFTTSTGHSQSSSINPAAAGGAQRAVVDAGYLALPGLGDENGLGHALSMGLIYPTRYAVFGGSARLLSSPFDDFPVGTTFGTDFSVAKELYPGMSVGAGLNFGFGTDWTAAADLGFRYNMGDRGMLKDFTWALTVGGLGKSWAPSPFTPAAGVAFDFLRVDGAAGKPDPLRLGLAADLGFPAFTNMAGKLGLSATIAELITLSSSTGFNLREAMDGAAPSPIPSIGITMNFTLKGGSRGEGRLPSDGEVAASLAARPLYDGVWAMGAGAAWTIGVADKRPPAITVDYPETRWISPNNDGKADYLEFPISITDQRYVAHWALEIFNDRGEAVRTYRNKERRPETEGVRNILDRLADVKSGVEVPATLRWDGILESGETASDGRYTFVLSAADDNGNTAASSRYEVVVDNTPPSVAVAEIPDSLKIFSPDGDGNKDSLEIGLSGSLEDLWVAGIHDAAGTKVRSFDIREGSPQTIVWDGKNDAGSIVADGVYGFRIAAEDRALNSTSAALDNIIVNTEQPTVVLLIGDGFFSPNGDAVKDTILLSPGLSSAQGIVDWTISVQDRAGTVHRTIAGGSAAPGRTEFDGRSDRGAVLAEGSYTAVLMVRYRNGYEAGASSPAFVLDLTPPRAAVKAEYPAFSPNNDGKLDEMALLQEGSEETAWTGEVRRVLASSPGAPGVLTRTFRFTGVPEARILWDGRDDSGRPAADGEYEYSLISVDRAGNTGRSNAVRFTLSTADTPVLLNTDRRAFSPNGDGVNDTLNISPQLQVAEGVASWRIDVLNADQAAVRSFEGRGALPPSVAWNGRDAGGAVLPDGTYTARAEIRYTMGNQPTATSQAFILDTRSPEASVSAPFTLFSPNGDGRRDFIPIEVATAGNDLWNADIRDSGGKVVASWEWRGSAPPVRWNGTDSAGNPVPDGTYRFALSSTDEAGNATRKVLEGIVVDSRIPRAFLTASAQAISPNGDGIADELRFSVILAPRDGIESWKLDILDENGTLRRSLGPAASAAGAAAPAETIAWDGKDASGAVREGRFTARLSVAYAKGDLVDLSAGPITVDVTPPALRFSYSPRYFSPDNDGVEDELTINLVAQDASPIASWSMEIREPQPPRQLFYRIEGRGAPAERIVWDGRSSKGELVQAATDYPVTFQAVDALGNAARIEGMIGVDVLVIREGDMLKIKVPSIIFRENAPDFDGLAQDTVDNNIRVLRRIAEILNRFRDYRVKVEGHANPVTRTAQEEQRELQPLSEARAKAVLDKLVEFGVDRSRLSSIGMGGTRPVVRWEDRNDWWKNRRVEFILIK